MSEKISKEQILSACIQKQEDLIKNFESRVDEMKADAYGQNQSASQSENRTAGKIELLSTLQSELGFAQMEMGYLKSMKPDVTHEIVEPGAVVVTDKRTFFIAVSSEVVEIDGQEIFGISTKAPLYQVMAGCKKGDKFEYNGTSYKIEDLY